MSWKELDEPTDDDNRELALQYRGKVRFLVDESAGIEVAKVLQNYGYNAKFVADLGLRGRSDENVFAAAWYWFFLAGGYLIPGFLLDFVRQW